MSSIVALVGLPNVGKSTLFNRMIKSFQSKDFITAITDKTPGITRDRNYADVQWEQKLFTVIDTGGLYFEDSKASDISMQVMEQAIAAMEDADLILHIMDGKAGINPFDMELAKTIRESGKKFLFIINKIDTPQQEGKIIEFCSLGDKIVPVSGLTGEGFYELMEIIIRLLPKTDSDYINKKRIEMDEMPKIAVVGRPNVGKSTLINSLLSKKRLIVSPVPGTTRDSIDTVCLYYGKKYLFIDTAGIRKGVGRSFYNQKDLLKGRYSSISTLIERMSVMKAIKGIQRADIVLIVLDASEGLTAQDQKIAGMVVEYGKGAILLLNKWDMVENPDISYKSLMQTIKRKLWFINYAPLLSISGLDRTRISKIFPLIDEINIHRKKTLSTDDLSAILADLSDSIQNAIPGTRDLKFKKIKQVGCEPPTFDIYVNRPFIIKDNILTFAEKIIRNRIPFKGTPIRIFFKSP